MNYPRETALQITKEIVVAKMQNSSVIANKIGGENVAEFFEEIYNKVSAIATDIAKDE